MSKEFFTVTPLTEVFEHKAEFETTGIETVPISDAYGRVLAEDIVSETDVPGFARATMDGYAVRAASTFGASESSPAYLSIRGRVDMGNRPETKIGPGQAVGIATGGMLPEGADAVVMLEHSAELDETALEVYKSVAPGTSIVAADEDYSSGDAALCRATQIRPQEMGLLAALGSELTCSFPVVA